MIQILQSVSFWFEILGLALIGGLGSALGEVTGYVVGYGTKKNRGRKNREKQNHAR